MLIGNLMSVKNVRTGACLPLCYMNRLGAEDTICLVIVKVDFFFTFLFDIALQLLNSLQYGMLCFIIHTSNYEAMLL